MKANKHFFIAIFMIFAGVFTLSAQLDTISPTAVCLSKATVLNKNEIRIYAKNFNTGSYDNLTKEEDLRFTFSDTKPEDDPDFDRDKNSSFMDLNSFPDDVIVTINVYVWDTAGNYAFCTVKLLMLPQSDNKGRVEGKITNAYGRKLNIPVNVKLINIFDKKDTFLTTNNDEGYYNFLNVKSGTYKLVTSSEDDLIHGVSTLDIVLIMRDILGRNKFINPYLYFAADFNDDTKINALDLIMLSCLIHGVKSYDMPPWRFGNADQKFDSIQNILSQGLQDDIYINVNDDTVKVDIVAIKVGDVNNSAIINGLKIENNFVSQEMDINNDVKLLSSSTFFTNSFVLPNQDTVVFSIPDTFLSEKINKVTLPVNIYNYSSVAGWQFSLKWDPNLMKIDEVNFNSDLIGTYSYEDQYDGVLNVIDFNCGETLKNSELLKVTFDILDANSGTIPIKFESDSGYEQGAYSDSTALPLLLKHGSISFNPYCEHYYKAYLDKEGEVVVKARDLYFGANKDDSITVNGENELIYSCDDIGMDTVSVLVYGDTDTVSCVSVIEIIDNMSPSLVCNDHISVRLDSNFQYHVDYRDLEEYNSDNCGIKEFSVEPELLDCDSDKDTKVTITATDYSGNSTDCVTIVTPLPPKYGDAPICKDSIIIDIFGAEKVLIKPDMLLADTTPCIQYGKVSLYDNIDADYPQNDNIVEYKDAGNIYAAKVEIMHTDRFCWTAIKINFLGFPNGCAFDPDNKPIPDVAMSYYGKTDELGCTQLKGSAPGNLIRANKYDKTTDGLNVLDVILLQKHMLGIKKLDSPYKILAADINENNRVSSSDLLQLIKYIIKLKDVDLFSWVFVDKSYDITFDNCFDSPRYITCVDSIFDYYFVGMKRGDLDHSYGTNFNYTDFYFEIDDKVLFNAEDYSISIYNKNKIRGLNGYQLSLKYDLDKIKVTDILSDENYFMSNRFEQDSVGVIKLLYYSSILQKDIEANTELLKIKFVAKDNGILHNVIAIDTIATNLMVTEQQLFDLGIHWDNYVDKIPFYDKEADIILYPQPAGNIVNVQYDKEEYPELRYEIYNGFGQKVIQSDLDGNTIDVSKVPEGMYFIRFSDAKMFLTTKKMLISK